MAKLRGRPKKARAIRQERNIGFFVTNAQWEIIQAKVKEAGVNISDYMRQVAVYGQVVTRWQKEERALFKQLVGMANDLNQLVVMARQEGVLRSMVYFEGYRGKIDVVIKRLGRDPRARVRQGKGPPAGAGSAGNGPQEGGGEEENDQKVES